MKYYPVIHYTKKLSRHLEAKCIFCKIVFVGVRGYGRERLKSKQRHSFPDENCPFYPAAAYRKFHTLHLFACGRPNLLVVSGQGHCPGY